MCECAKLIGTKLQQRYKVFNMEIQFLNQAQIQLESDEKLDVDMLDKVVQIMNNGSGEPQKIAANILARFKEQPNSWMKVDAVLEYAKFMETKYYALQILETLIQVRWKALPRDQCEGIKGFIVQTILDVSSDKAKAEAMKLYLQKLDLVLVQIVKHEWPRLWPTFISDIVGASRTNESLCMNNMQILRLLSEEVFEFGTGLTSIKAMHLKQQFCGEFEAVHKLCKDILENTDNVALIYATLNTLHGFLNWIPVGYIFEENLVDLIVEKFLPYPFFRSISVQCLIEISSINIDERPPIYGQRLVNMYRRVITMLMDQVPDDVDFNATYMSGSNEDQKFLSNLAQLLATFLKEHYKLVEVIDEKPNVIRPDQNDRNELKEFHQRGLDYLLKLSEIEDVEVFKVCLDYWNWLCVELFRESPFPQPPQHGLLDAFRRLREDRNESPRRRLYVNTLSRLRMLMINRMAKPEEVIVVVNEHGEAVRELVKDTDSVTLYKTMRETLVLLTHLDYRDTEIKMTEKLQAQVNGSEWSWKNLNTLCWAIGSISGAMHEDDEKRFLVTVIRDLLGLCEQKRGKDNKAVIASNIMYVVGQYPRFLRVHWKFLKTVINKLFEFMHESHEGVQDMACDTFIKIVIKCKPHFVMIQPGESRPFINDLLENLNGIICDLSHAQVHVFYEAVGHIISVEPEPAVKEDLIDKLMALPNSIWAEIIDHASSDVNMLCDAEVVKNLAHILKTNVAACKSIGAPFFSQLKKILMDMLGVYQVISSNVSKAISEHGEGVLKQPLLKSMRVVKREILVLLSTWIARSFEARAEQDQISAKTVIENVINPLFGTVMTDYLNNVPEAREPKVLSLLSITVVALKEQAAPQVPAMLDAVFECTLDMINKDLEAFPEHRTNFFQLLNAITRHCFKVLLALPDNVFVLVIQAVVWAFKHSMRNVAETGLEILREMFSQVAGLEDRAAAQAFYQKHYMNVLQHVLSVVTDNNQIPFVGLTNLSETMCLVFQAAEFSITVHLNPNSPQPALTLGMTQEQMAAANMEYIFQVIGELLATHFKNLSPDQIRIAIKGFFSFNRQVTKMRDHIRDFLIQIKEEAGEDTSDLFLEEKEAEIQKTQQEKLSIPGVQNPNDVVDDEDMV